MNKNTIAADAALYHVQVTKNLANSYMFNAAMADHYSQLYCLYAVTDAAKAANAFNAWLYYETRCEILNGKCSST